MREVGPAHFRALRLAEVVLAAESFEQHVGALTVTGFIFDMWRTYEDFVAGALTDALRPHGGACRPQFRMTMDEADEVTMKPDLVWLAPDSRPRAVVDAKYKAERPEGFPDADLYQMLAYCTVLGLTIYCHTLDLSLPPASVLADVQRVANTVRKTALDSEMDSY